jgi:hypothetical protein
MHATGERAAENDAALPVVAHALEFCAAFLPVCAHFAHPDLVAHHLYRLAALRFPAKKYHIFLKFHEVTLYTSE